ncbi:hypothetical protein OS493_016605 [Desmophyllum pertusum]|uniref:Uncharacterized protein n=1 Tax=Desmophyllum pertusum TaxID=174260 RepID=A0A9W9ZE89_9CNID|nr:hypothetical protein OS493_016605 [Desmophyllum pertusum]
MELGLQSSQVRHVKQSFVPPFKDSNRAVEMPPPSPPMLDDILSQMSQRELSSTQLFRSNAAEYFNNARNKASSSIDLSSFGKGGASFHNSQLNHKHSNDWFASGSQITHSGYLQPSQLTINEEETDYGDEEVVQDSPELFTQRSDFHLYGDPFETPDLEHAENSEEDEENHRSYQVPAPQYNFDTPGQLVIPVFGDRPGNTNTAIGLRSINEIRDVHRQTTGDMAPRQGLAKPLFLNWLSFGNYEHRTGDIQG